MSRRTALFAVVATVAALAVVVPSGSRASATIETGRGAGEKIVIVYDGANLTGSSLQIFGDDTDFKTHGGLEGTSFGVESLEVYGGMVVAAYSGTQYQGACQTFSGRDRDLSDDQIGPNAIRSIRFNTTCAGATVMDPVIYSITAAVSDSGFATCPADAVQADMDANDEAGGDYIWICLHYRERAAGPYVKGIQMASYPQHTLYDTSNGAWEDQRYTQCTGTKALVDVDLNSGAGGDYQYFCAQMGTTGMPMRDLEMFHPGHLERHGESNFRPDNGACAPWFVGRWDNDFVDSLDDFEQGEAFGPTITQEQNTRAGPQTVTIFEPSADVNSGTHALYGPTLATCVLYWDEPQPPNVHLSLVSRTPAPNDNGWNNTPVTLVYDCASDTDGTVTQQTTTISTEGQDQPVTGIWCDGEIPRERVSIDTTAPGIGMTSQPTPDGSGWFTQTPLTWTWGCADGLSGVTSESVDQTITGDGADQTVTGTCTDLAGNTASESVTADVDSTPPTLELESVYPAPVHGNWSSGERVTVTWKCIDTGSEPVYRTVSTNIEPEGENLTASGTCTDHAGLSATAMLLVSHDNTDPVLTLTADPEPNEHGWNNTDVFVQGDCSDALSGIPHQTHGEATFSAESPSADGWVIPASCFDRAGNEKSGTITVRIDKTPPHTGTVTQAPAPNTYGWNNSSVEVTFECLDGLSGPLDGTVTDTADGEGTNRVAQADCVDKAGNRFTARKADINIDTTPPQGQLVSVEPVGTDDGWHNSAVTVTWTCTDGLSGVVQETVTTTITAEGADQTATAECADRAGNRTTLSQDDIDIDLTNPVVTFSGNAGTYGVDQSVSITCSATDALSGIARTTCAGASGPAYGFAVGTNTISAEATDRAANVGTATTTFEVVVTYDNLCTLSRRFSTSATVDTQLCAYLARAKTAELRGNSSERDAQLQAYRNVVSANSGRALTAYQADVLKRLSIAL